MAGLGVCRGRLSGRRASITRFLRVRHLQTAEFSLSAARQLPKSRTNTLINFVPQQQAWVVERFGKYLKTLQPGLNVLIPVVDQIRYVQSLKEAVVDIPSQSAITEDNVTLHLDGVLYYRVIEPYLVSCPKFWLHHNDVTAPPGILWGRECRVCSGSVGTNDNEI
jgi:hypothetical protein